MESLLVIDDESSICKTIQSVLQTDTLRVLVASTVEKGMQLLQEESPHVILLDVRIGKESGLDLFQQIHRINPKIMIIFISGHASADTVKEAMDAGAFDFLIKPLDLDNLQKTVFQAFRINRFERRRDCEAIHNEIGDACERCGTAADFRFVGLSERL